MSLIRPRVEPARWFRASRLVNSRSTPWSGLYTSSKHSSLRSAQLPGAFYITADSHGSHRGGFSKFPRKNAHLPHAEKYHSTAKKNIIQFILFVLINGYFRQRRTFLTVVLKYTRCKLQKRFIAYSNLLSLYTGIILSRGISALDLIPRKQISKNIFVGCRLYRQK